MTRVVLAIADQSLVGDVQRMLAEIEGTHVVYVAESTSDLVTAVAAHDPDVVFVHDQLGPEPVFEVVRDLAHRRPAAAVVLTADSTRDVLQAAMEAGARGLLVYPLAYEDVATRLRAAAEHAERLRSLVTGGGRSDGGRARLVAVAGSKGGVGTTTVATHLAIVAMRAREGSRVCLIDLDLEKGDVSWLLQVRHRADIADLARAASDLSARTVGDAVVAHESGIDVLLTPPDIRDVEDVTPQALRAILALVRQDYDLVVVDGGSHVTAVQAALIELADDVVAILTPDVLGIRSLRRAITAWSDLGVRRETDVRVIVNQTSRDDEVPADAVARLVDAPVLAPTLPAMFRRLEPAVNARDPSVVSDPSWWRSVTDVAVALGLLSRAEATASTEARRATTWWRARAADIGGSISIETVALFPVVLGVLLVCWQVVLVALTFVWTGQAADAAARASSVGGDPQRAAVSRLPRGVADDVTVTTADDEVRVTVRVPLLVPAGSSTPIDVTSSTAIVREPIR